MVVLTLEMVNNFAETVKNQQPSKDCNVTTEDIRKLKELYDQKNKLLNEITIAQLRPFTNSDEDKRKLNIDILKNNLKFVMQEIKSIEKENEKEFLV